MFDNILHQERAVEALSRDLAAGSLPPALLFHGPDHAGKLSTALELARVLSCQTPGAPWGCACAHCSQHKHLLSPYLLMLGQRYFLREIRACGRALAADGRDASRFLFLRAVRKLVRRFDPVLLEGETRLANAIKPIEKIEDKLDALLPGRPALSPHELDAVLEEIYKQAETLAGLLPQDGLSIAMIRRVTYWAHTADAQQNKFIVIENAELMNESARNSLLKVLEEPPPKVWFILLSSQKSAIMPTILSRVRPYAFAARGLREQDVLERIFKQPRGTWPDIKAFFIDSQPGGGELIRERADLLADALLRRMGLGCLLEPRHAAGVEEATAGLGTDRAAAEDLVRATVAALLSWLPRLDAPEAAAPLAAAGLGPIAAADQVQACCRRLLSHQASMAGFNLTPAALFERVWFETLPAAVPAQSAPGRGGARPNAAGGMGPATAGSEAQPGTGLAAGFAARMAARTNGRT